MSHFCPSPWKIAAELREATDAGPLVEADGSLLPLRRRLEGIEPAHRLIGRYRICPTCRTAFERFEAWADRCGHPEVLVATEVEDAERRVGEYLDLRNLPRLAKARAEEEASWTLTKLLLAASEARRFEDPEESLSLARVAAIHVERLLAAEWSLDLYGEAWLLRLKAEALAHVGNAYRMLGEFHKAEASFLSARLGLYGCGEPEELVTLVESLYASLLVDQDRFEEAEVVLRELLALYQRTGCSRGYAKARIQLGRIAYEMGDPTEAVRHQMRALGRLDEEEDREILHGCLINLAWSLIEAGALLSAKVMILALPRELSEELGNRRLWVEGLLWLAEDQLGAARRAFEQLRSAYLARRRAYDAALVGLDLGQVLLAEGRIEEALVLGEEILPVLAEHGVRREAAAALGIFRAAVKSGSLSREVLGEVVLHLRRGQRPPA